MLAEDVNVPSRCLLDDRRRPSAAEQQERRAFSAAPVNVDARTLLSAEHEYEIFTTAKRSHTLGALLAGQSPDGLYLRVP